MKKNYLRDEHGKVVNYMENLVQMNMFEYMHYNKYFINEYTEATIDSIIAIGKGILTLFIIAIYPISALTWSWYWLNQVKKNVGRLTR